MAESTHTAAAPDTCAVVAAGGLGLRFGDARGKQYVELCGLPVLDWSVAALDEAPSVGHIVIVCPHGRVEETRKIVGLIAPCVPVTFVEGGATRQESCLAGIRAVPGDFPLVAIHDGARPLVSEAVITEAVTRDGRGRHRARSRRRLACRRHLRPSVR